ncbi:hypothetical protein GF1_02260 [Desulfolithobacter dissulfuricans]|uniref:Uncharacterized protein n=1 Tax=Desulfolithobacter dissulfuricans TaxID=2795293 RepID=A0A915U8Z2_9BACT|nr:hypothetical protein GF1_02260 [Desulfolithobacter dissulfuricans]
MPPLCSEQSDRQDQGQEKKYRGAEARQEESWLLARIFHNDRGERSENAVDADSERRETFEEQLQKEPQTY